MGEGVCDGLGEPGSAPVRVCATPCVTTPAGCRARHPWRLHSRGAAQRRSGAGRVSLIERTGTPLVTRPPLFEVMRKSALRG